MSSIRLSLCAIGYPNVAPNCLVVLQSLRTAGFDILLRDVYYRDKDAIEDYFDQLGIPVKFDHVKEPEIDVLRNKIKILNKSYIFCSWQDIDELCLKAEIYSRNSRYSFIPSYKPDTYFMVLNYGEKTQIVDSNAHPLSTIKSRATTLVNSGKSSSVTIVDANTLQIMGVTDKNGFEEFEDIVYFNNEL